MQIDALSGISAGIVSNLVSHPLDTVKVRIQINRHLNYKLLTFISDIYKLEGVIILFIRTYGLLFIID